MKTPTPTELSILASYTVNVATGQVWDSEGNEICNAHTNGYVYIRIRQGQSLRNFKRANLIWWKAKGEWPPLPLDHDNRNRIDDSITNLIPKAHRQNMTNHSSTIKKGNGLPVGVVWCKTDQRFRAHITINGKLKHLGNHRTAEGAIEARRRAEQELLAQYPKDCRIAGRQLDAVETVHPNE